LRVKRNASEPAEFRAVPWWIPGGIVVRITLGVGAWLTIGRTNGLSVRVVVAEEAVGRGVANAAVLLNA